MAVESIPGILQKQALTPAVRYFDGEAYNQSKIRQLFGTPEVYSEEEISWEIEQVMRRIGTWHAAPATADREADVQAGKKRARVSYWAESFFLTPNELALYKDFGESADLPLSLQDAIRKRDRTVNRKTQLKVQKANRAVEQLAAAVLSTASASVVVDGVTQTLNYGAQTQTASATWATASTNIIEEWAEWVADFVEAAGGLPTHLCYSHRFFPSYIAVNDDFRQYDIRHPGDQMNVLLSAVGLDPASITLVPVYDRYLNSSDSVTQMWATDKLTMLRLDSDDVLEMATCRTLDNDMNGGLFSYPIMHTNPKQLEVVVNNNCLPIIRDPNKVMICDLVP